MEKLFREVGDFEVVRDAVVAFLDARCFPEQEPFKPLYRRLLKAERPPQSGVVRTRVMAVDNAQTEV